MSKHGLAIADLKSRLNIREQKCDSYLINIAQLQKCVEVEERAISEIRASIEVLIKDQENEPERSILGIPYV